MEIKILSQMNKQATDSGMAIHLQLMDLCLDDSHEALAKRAILRGQMLIWSAAIGDVCKAIQEFKSNCDHKNNYEMSYLGGKLKRFHCDDCGYARRVIQEEDQC